MHRQIRVHRSGRLHFDRWYNLDDIGCYLKSTIICLWSILVIWPEKISSMRFSTCRLQRRSHNEESSWRCDCSCRLHRGHGEQVRQKTDRAPAAAAMTWEIRIFSVNTAETKRCQRTMNPFLLIRGRFVERKGLLPPPLLRQWWGFHVCVGSWRSEGTCILSGRRQRHTDLSSGQEWKRRTLKASSVTFVYHPPDSE